MWHMGFQLFSLPEFLDFKLFGKTILVVRMQSSGFFGGSTQKVSAGLLRFVLLLPRKAEKVKGGDCLSMVPPKIARLGIQSP